MLLDRGFLKIVTLDIGRNWTLPLGAFQDQFYQIFLLGEIGRHLILGAPGSRYQSIPLFFLQYLTVFVTSNSQSIKPDPFIIGNITIQTLNTQPNSVVRQSV